MEITKKGTPLLVYFLLLLSLLIFTLLTSFNLIGYQYQFIEEDSTLIVEKGFFSKEFYKVDSANSLKWMININQANEYWNLNIYAVPLILATSIWLYSKTKRNKPKYKWFIDLYLIAVGAFFVWNIVVHYNLLQNILILK